MRVLSSLLAVLSTASCAPLLDFSSYSLTARQDSPPTGYLGVFFLGAQPDIYFYISNGNDALSMSALNGGQPVITATQGTKGVRDPSIISGGGTDAGKKWYIIGTDLDIDTTTWDASQRTGSRSIFVWESTDLVTWEQERLVEVEDATAGMVWAPSAIFDSEKGEYLVHWSSKFYAADDAQHTGSPGATTIRYAYTKDFKTFSAPADYVNASPTNVIDLDILSMGNEAYARFIKDESAKTVYTEISTTGLFGTWSRPGGDNTVIETGVEGPAAFWDNEIAGKAHLLLDFYGDDGYRPYECTDVSSGKWTASDRKSWPANLRHGSVLQITEAQVSALNAKYAVAA